MQKLREALEMLSSLGEGGLAKQAIMDLNDLNAKQNAEIERLNGIMSSQADDMRLTILEHNSEIAALQARIKDLEDNTAEVKHPIGSDCKIKPKSHYCYQCGTSVKNQRYCHGCGRKLIWPSDGNIAKQALGKP